MSITFWHPASPESLNLSNSNASALLHYLGLPAGPAGDLDAQDLIVRCASIRHTGHGLDECGRPDAAHQVDDDGLSLLDVDLGGPRLIDCGADPATSPNASTRSSGSPSTSTRRRAELQLRVNAGRPHPHGRPPSRNELTPGTGMAGRAQS